MSGEDTEKRSLLKRKHKSKKSTGRSEKGDGNDATASISEQNKDRIKIKKRKKKETEEDEADSGMDTDTENTLKEERDAKIQNVKKLKSELSETIVQGKTQEKRIEDEEKTEKNKQVEEMKERKREKRKRKREALRQQKKTQKDRESGAEVESVAGREAVKYLRTWQTDKQSWKFNKVRQVWLLKNMYDSKQLSDDDFEILLSYLEGLKGKSRDQTVTEAETLINNSNSGNHSNSDSENEEEISAEGPKSSISQEKSGRIRKILQILT